MALPLRVPFYLLVSRQRCVWSQDGVRKAALTPGSNARNSVLNLWLALFCCQYIIHHPCPPPKSGGSLGPDAHQLQRRHTRVLAVGAQDLLRTHGVRHESGRDIIVESAGLDEQSLAAPALFRRCPVRQGLLREYLARIIY